MCRPQELQKLYYFLAITDLVLGLMFKECHFGAFEIQDNLFVQTQLQKGKDDKCTVE